jgi:hypothetical protein
MDEEVRSRMTQTKVSPSGEEVGSEAFRPRDAQDEETEGRKLENSPYSAFAGAQIDAEGIGSNNKASVSTKTKSPATIRFQDNRGKKFGFPWKLCRTWEVI